MRQKIALLWDIDGTLLTTGGLGRGPLLDAIQSATGHEGDYDLVTSSGLTDHQIVNQILEPFGLAGNNLDELINQILEDYCVRYTELLITKKLKILNRVGDILQVLHEQENRYCICDEWQNLNLIIIEDSLREVESSFKTNPRSFHH